MPRLKGSELSPWPAVGQNAAFVCSLFFCFPFRNLLSLKAARYLQNVLPRLLLNSLCFDFLEQPRLGRHKIPSMSPAALWRLAKNGEPIRLCLNWCSILKLSWLPFMTRNGMGQLAGRHQLSHMAGSNVQERGQRRRRALSEQPNAAGYQLLAECLTLLATLTCCQPLCAPLITLWMHKQTPRCSLSFDYISELWAVTQSLLAIRPKSLSFLPRGRHRSPTEDNSCLIVNRPKGVCSWFQSAGNKGSSFFYFCL